MGDCQKVAWLVMPKWPKVKLRRGLKGPLSSLKFMGQNLYYKLMKKVQKIYKNQKKISKNTPYTPVFAWIGVYFIPKREWKDTKE
jgi:hypothetical protein